MIAQIQRRPLLACLLLGALSALGFAPLFLWPLTLLALALLFRLIAAAPRLRSALARGWWFGMGHFTIGNNWIAHAFVYQDKMPHWLGWLAVPLLSLYLAIFIAIAAALAWFIADKANQRRYPSLGFALIIAGSWLIAEWLRSWVLTGFAWNPIGAVMVPTQVPNLVAPWIGTYGLGAVTLLLAAAADALVRATARLDRSSFRAMRSGQWVVVLFVAVLVLPRLFFVFLAGPLGLDRAPALPGGTPVTVVQPNIDQGNKWNPADAGANLARLSALSTRIPGTPPRLLLWPEAAVTDYLESGYPLEWYSASPEVLRARLAGLLGPGDVLLTGGVKLDPNAQGTDITGARNAVFALDSQGRLTQRYDKAHLVPFGEYLPMRPLLATIGISRLAPGAVDFIPGPGPRSLDLGPLGHVGVQVCYEIIFSGQVVDRAHRPQFIFNPSNDAWFGAWGPPQHLAQARLRAIEEGLPVIRSTPTGISAVIDSDGRLVATIGRHRAGRIDTRVPPSFGSTFFARHGNATPLVFALLLVALGVALRWRRR